MKFRDGFLGLVKDAPTEVVDTAVGKVLVKAPLADRVEFFRKELAKDGTLEMTAPLMIAMACHDPETGDPCFGPSDVSELKKIPIAGFNKLVEVVQRLVERLSLDPTSPERQPGSD